MSAPLVPPALQIHRKKAPEPSAALLALQERGLELPTTRRISISPQSNGAQDNDLCISPLSISSTPSQLQKSPSPAPRRYRSPRRPSSAGSAETTVTNILRLYTGEGSTSKQSLRSEYEEMSPYSDDSDEERPDIPRVHQPKAYRDTIAPLLEHQFSGDGPTVPPVPSPMSIASMPMLLHPHASASVPSLHLTPEASPNLQPSIGHESNASHSSIQITPDMSPPLQPIVPSFQEYSQSLVERKIALEVPDVRDADSWYDQPLSPVSPEEVEGRFRDSQMSAVSPEGNVDYHRAITFESLGPPKPKQSPNVHPVSVVSDYFDFGISSATASANTEHSMIPPALDLTKGRPLSKVPEGSAPVHQAELHISESAVDGGLKSQHASLDLVAHDPIEGPMRTYLTPPPPRRLSGGSNASSRPPVDIEEIYRPNSAISDSSESSPTHDTFGGHLKQAFRGKFGKKKDKEKDKTRARPEIKTRHTTNATGSKTRSSFEDDPESYKISYWKSRASGPSQYTTLPVDPIQASETDVAQNEPLEQAQNGSVQSGPGPSVSGSPQPPDMRNQHLATSSPPLQRRQPSPAIPLTEYQKYGSEIWSESAKKKREKEQQAARKAAEKAEKESAKAAAKAQKVAAKAEAAHTSKTSQHRLSLNMFLHGVTNLGTAPAPTPAQPSVAAADRFQTNFYARPSSKAGPGHAHNTSDSTQDSQQSMDMRPSSRPGSSASFASSNARRSGGGMSSYNNDLFEASGGAKKRSGFASRLMMSSEEKRKQKVKESIVVVGGGKMGKEGGKGLVKI
ncbi:hypothetical protein LTR05_004384 [Lithohypha guttulata]|uniref:Uncharacterized protein n=1 Tax=Lithohypha guttulata TaxID=1690604 RepID=A0AAN7T2L9_9EURO|nr:hypothetical protein LTR05_004384 [Lithohypha guttulata]